MRHIVSIASVLTVLLALPLSAQQIRGTVVLQGTVSRVAGATVTLLDAELAPVDSTRTDENGTFVFTRVRAGRYALQAARSGMQTALVDVELSSQPAELVLELPSPVVVLAMTCGASEDPRASTLVGVVHDANTTVPIPGARLELTWENGRSDAVTDARGLFRFCALPVGRLLALTAHALGRQTKHSLVLTDAAINRLDVPLDIGAVSFNLAVTSRRDVPGAATGTVTFLLRDAATGAPIQGAAVWLGRNGNATFSNASGAAHFVRVQPGETEVRVEMIGYGMRSTTFAINAAEEVQVMVRVPPKPVALEPIAIHSTMRSEFRTPRESSTRVDVMAGAELLHAEERAAMVGDVLRTFPGVLVTEGTYSTVDNPDYERIICVESVRRLDRLRLPPGVKEPFCDMIVVVYDGVPTTAAGPMLRNMSVRDLESIEYLGPLEAGIRFGTRAAQTGALLLWSRGTGPHKSGGRNRG